MNPCWATSPIGMAWAPPHASPAKASTAAKHFHAYGRITIGRTSFESTRASALAFCAAKAAHHKMLSLFVRLTLAVAVAIVALFVLAFVLKVVLIAAVVAAVVVGVMLAMRLARRRAGKGTVVQRG